MFTDVIEVNGLTFQLLLFRSFLYVLIPSVAGSWVAHEINGFINNRKIKFQIYYLFIGITTGFLLLALTTILPAPWRDLFAITLFGIEKLQIIIIAVSASFVVTFLISNVDKILRILTSLFEIIFIQPDQSVRGGQSRQYQDIVELLEKVNADSLDKLGKVADSDNADPNREDSHKSENDKLKREILSPKEFNNEQTVTNSDNALEKIIDEERRRSAVYKNVVVNLYMVVNLMYMYAFIGNGKVIPEQLAYAAIGFYFSLSMFLVYLFRVSNTRSAVLLSISEDLHKKNEVEAYLTDIRKGEAPTDNDVEIIRMLLVNRAEREKPGHHPYELILKGITNSNIQLKGGKMGVTKPKGNET
jgi:hypothetical protein